MNSICGYKNGNRNILTFSLHGLAMNVRGKGSCDGWSVFVTPALFTLWQGLISLSRLIGCMLFTVFIGSISRIWDVSLSCERLYVFGACISMKVISEDLWLSHLTQSVRLSLPVCPERYSNPQLTHRPTYPLTNIHVNTNNSTHRWCHVAKIKDASWEECVFMYTFMVDLQNWGGVRSASAICLPKMRTRLTPLPRVPFPTDLVRKCSVRSYLTYEESIIIKLSTIPKNF